MTELVCSFTGHRFIPENKYEEISNNLEKMIRKLIKYGFVCFMSGGAIGFDTLAAETVLKLKYEFPFIKLKLALPCQDQDKFWSSAQKAEYRKILSMADSVYYASQNYCTGCMHRRNRYLVDNCKILISYFNGTGGGTAYTVGYAYKNGVKIFNVC